MCIRDRDNEAHGKSAGCRSWKGGVGGAKAPSEGADPAGTPERKKADEPLWRQKRHACLLYTSFYDKADPINLPLNLKTGLPHH